MDQSAQYADGPSLPQILDALRAGLVFALVVGVAVAVLGEVLHRVTAPRYLATSTVLVSQPAADLSRMGLAYGTPSALDLDVYQRVAESDALLSQAASSLGGSRAFEGVRFKVDTGTAPSSGLLRVSAEGPSAATAAKAADAVAGALVAWDQTRVHDGLKNAAGVLQQQIKSLSDRIRGASGSVAGGPPQQSALVNLLAQREDDLYAIQALEGTNGGSLQILEKASVPTKRAGPGSAIIAIGGLVAGFFLGYAIFLIARALDQRIHHVDQVTHATGLPVLAKLPPHTGRPKQFGSAMRLMASRILLNVPEGERPLVLLATSLEDSEARPLVATSLARALAGLGNRTLLIDASSMRPSLADFVQLNADAVTSLRAVLESPNVPFNPVRIDIASGSHVDVLPNVGTRGIPTMLLHDSFPIVVDRWKLLYDAIIIDVAPLQHSADALALAQTASKTIVVTDLHVTDVNALHDAVNVLRRTETDVLGVAVARIPKFRFRLGRTTPSSVSRREEVTLASSEL